MSDSSIASGVDVMWGRVFDLHTAFRRHDIAEAASLLIVFPDSPDTANHTAAAGDYMYALARFADSDAVLDKAMLDAYRETYLKSYASIIGTLTQRTAPGNPAEAPTH